MLHKWSQIVFVDDIASPGEFAGLKRMRIEDLRGIGAADEIVVVIAVGEPRDRMNLAERVHQQGHLLESIISPLASISPDARIGAGSIIYPGSFVGPGSSIGGNCLLMHGVALCHDSVLGDHSVCACGVKIAGNCKIGQGTYLGLNSSVREQTIVGERSIIGMGSVVLNEMPSQIIAYGNPARIAGKSADKRIFRKKS